MIKKLRPTLLFVPILILCMIQVSAEDTIILTDEDFEISYMAAPAVAGLILEEADIDNRYGTGKDGGNYITDVARAMTHTTSFPDFDWDGNWDGVSFVDKTDDENYYEAVYKFLVFKGANLPSYFDMEGLWIYGINYRRLIIEHQHFGNFEGTLTDSAGTPLGIFTGSIGDRSNPEFYLYYHRGPYSTINYFAIFNGSMSDCNTIEGIRVHGNDGILRNGDGEPVSFLITRQ